MQISLKDYQVTEVPVQWGEMNATLHVGNATYLVYAEAGQMAYFDSINFIVDVSNALSPIGPIISDLNCRYKMPLTYPDTLSIATKVLIETIDEYSFEMEQIIVSHKSERIAAEVKKRIVSYDYQTLKKAPLPFVVKQKIMQKR